MGYESKLVLVSVRTDFMGSRGYGEIIAELNCSCMGIKFWKFWKDNSKPIDYRVYIESDDEPTEEDKYGARLTEMSADAVLAWLKSDADPDLKTYRRAKLLAGLLKSVKPKDWGDEDLRLVHYGY